MRTRTCILLAVVIVSNAFGNVVLGHGMREVGDISSYSPVDLIRSGIVSLSNPWVAGGVGLLAIFFAAHTLLLSWADLSYVLLVTSIGYVLVVLLGATLLDETVTPLRWAGALLIAAGVGVVGSTPESTVEVKT